jgi:predicted NAD-dependent protein-ADP-ribosyltransferase YbiA (DUF1768 family)
MNGFQLIFKNGTVATVYTKAEHYTDAVEFRHIDPDALAAVIDLKRNIDSEAKFLAEYRTHIKELHVNQQKVNLDVEVEMFEHKQREANRLKSEQSRLAQVRLEP